MKTLKVRGDVSIYSVLMVMTASLLLLLAVAQRFINQSRLFRDSLSSQQAFQAALTGIDVWEQQFKDTGSLTEITNQPVSGDATITYTVTFDDVNDTLTSIGSVDRGDKNIRRSIEVQY